MSEIVLDTGEIIVDDVLKAENEKYLRGIVEAQTARGKAKTISGDGVVVVFAELNSMVLPSSPGSRTYVEIRRPIYEASPDDLDPVNFKVTYYQKTHYEGEQHPVRENVLSYEPHRDSSIIPLEMFDGDLRKRFPHVSTSLDNRLLFEINGDLKDACERLQARQVGDIAIGKELALRPAA